MEYFEVSPRHLKRPDLFVVSRENKLLSKRKEFDYFLKYDSKKALLWRRQN